MNCGSTVYSVLSLPPIIIWVAIEQNKTYTIYTHH